MNWALFCVFVAGCAATPANGKSVGSTVDETGESGATPGDAGGSGDSDSPASASSEAGPGAAPKTPEPVAGPFSEDRVQEIVRANFDKMGACYAEGLKRDQSLKGTINVNLTIDGRGTVVNASAPKSDKPKPKPAKPKKVPYWQRNKQKQAEELITDTKVVTCVEDEFKALRFPPTGRGLVTLVYPVVFRTE